MLSDDDMMSPKDCMSTTALQISFLCSAMSHDVTKPLSYDVTLDDDYQQQVLEVLDCAIRQQDQHVLHAALILVQVRGLHFPANVFANHSAILFPGVAASRVIVCAVANTYRFQVSTLPVFQKVLKVKLSKLKFYLSTFYLSKK